MTSPPKHFSSRRPSSPQQKWTVTLVGAGLLLFSGCQMATIPAMPLTTTKYTLQQTEKLSLMDSRVQGSVSSTGIQHSVLADGRLQVVVNIKNRDSQPNRVELSILFKSADSMVDVGESPWQVIELDAFATQAVKFVSTSVAARNFKVRVRQVSR